MGCNVYLLKCDFGDEVNINRIHKTPACNPWHKELKTGNANYIKIIHVHPIGQSR
jgi:hypothetical protein